MADIVKLSPAGYRPSVPGGRVQSLTYSARQVGAAGDVVEVARLHLLLVGLAVVEVVEVGHDDRHRKRYGQHAGDGAQRADNFTPDANRPAAEAAEAARHRWRTWRASPAAEVARLTDGECDAAGARGDVTPVAPTRAGVSPGYVTVHSTQGREHLSRRSAVGMSINNAAVTAQRCKFKTLESYSLSHTHTMLVYSLHYYYETCALE